MRRVVLALVAWTARVAVWGTLLSLAAYVLWNHQAISVRGQIARLGIERDPEQTLGALLEDAGLEYLLESFSSGLYYQNRAGPLWCLKNEPVILSLVGNLDGMDDPNERVDGYIVFDRDGLRVGAPIIMQRGPGGRGYGGPIRILDAESTHWLVFLEYAVAATTQPTTGPAIREFTYRVYRLAGSEWAEVFVLQGDWPANQSRWLNTTRGDDGKLALELKTSLRRAWNPQTIATFLWDESAGRFVGPTADPQGWWEVASPAPDPLSDTAG